MLLKEEIALGTQFIISVALKVVQDSLSCLLKCYQNCTAKGNIQSFRSSSLTFKHGIFARLALAAA